MSDTKRVRTEIQKAMKMLLASKNRQIAENGRDQTLPVLDAKTGFWEDRGKWSKPARWLLILEVEPDGKLQARLPRNDHAKRVAGSVNAAQEIHMGISTRVVVAVREDDGYVLLPEFEWLLLFVFPDLPVNVAKNDSTSGDTASFDPSTGRLLMKERYAQPYIAAGLVKLCEDPPPYRSAGKQISYDQATDAIADLINLDLVPPRA